MGVVNIISHLFDGFDKMTKFFKKKGRLGKLNKMEKAVRDNDADTVANELSKLRKKASDKRKTS